MRQAIRFLSPEQEMHVQVRVEILGAPDVTKAVEEFFASVRAFDFYARMHADAADAADAMEARREMNKHRDAASDQIKQVEVMMRDELAETLSCRTGRPRRCFYPTYSCDRTISVVFGPKALFTSVSASVFQFRGIHETCVPLKFLSASTASSRSFASSSFAFQSLFI